MREARAGVQPLGPEEIARTRTDLEAFADGVVVADDVLIEPHPVGGRPGLRVAPRGGGPTRTGLLLHGGGFRAGSPRAARGVASHLALRAGVELRVPAYRLAPEHPFPAALDDVVAALAELVAEVDDPREAFVVGESAGGGLAVAALIAARASGVPVPGTLVLLSPWLDLTVASDSYDRLADRDRIIDRATSLGSAGVYLAGHDARDPLASPALAGDADLAALPSTLVQVSDDEVLLDEAVAFHGRLRELGVPSRLERWSGVSHLWHVQVPDGGPADAAIDAAGLYLES